MKTNETPQQILQRRKQNMQRMIKKRQIAGYDEILKEKMKLLARMTRKRANETQVETMERKGENTARMKRRRVNETQEETIKRKKLDNQRISAKRNESNIDIVMKKFHCQVKVGPVYVCTVCHRLMYKEGVVKIQVARYKKSSSERLQKVFAVKFRIKSFNNQGWICRACDSALMKGKMPIQAKANGLTLDEVPQEL